MQSQAPVRRLPTACLSYTYNKELRHTLTVAQQAEITVVAPTCANVMVGTVMHFGTIKEGGERFGNMPSNLC